MVCFLCILRGGGGGGLRREFCDLGWATCLLIRLDNTPTLTEKRGTSRSSSSKSCGEVK